MIWTPQYTPTSVIAQIDPEKYPEQKSPKMVDPDKKLSPAEYSLNLFRIDFSN